MLYVCAIQTLERNYQYDTEGHPISDPQTGNLTYQDGKPLIHGNYVVNATDAPSAAQAAYEQFAGGYYTGSEPQPATNGARRLVAISVLDVPMSDFTISETHSVVATATGSPSPAGTPSGGAPVQ